MSVDWQINNLWNWDDDNPDAFFSPMWTDRTEDSYSDFFKDGGWKKPKNWINPGGVMANPAQQIADPGNFFTSEEHENWLDGDVSDRTAASAAVAGTIYGGASALGGLGGGASGGEAGAGASTGSSGGGAMNFDWLSNLFGGGESSGGAVEAGTGNVAQGSGSGFWDTFFSDPNNIQMLGEMGSRTSQGQPIGQAAGETAMGQSRNQAYQRQAQQQTKTQQDTLKALIELMQGKEGSELVGPTDDTNTPDSITVKGGTGDKPGNISLSYSNPTVDQNQSYSDPLPESQKNNNPFRASW